jgi:hypothetical protein
MTLQSVDQVVDEEAAMRAAETQVVLAAGAFGAALRKSP